MSAGLAFMLGYFLFNFVVVQGNTGSMTFIGQTVLLFVVAYFAIAGFGYFFKHMIYDKVAKKWEQLHPEENKNDDIKEVD